MAVTFVLGLILAPLHWTGLVIAGGLLGLTAPTVRRAVVLGTTYGLVLLGLFAVWLVVHGALGKFLAMGELALATVALGISLPLLAAGAVRGLT